MTILAVKEEDTEPKDVCAGKNEMVIYEDTNVNNNDLVRKKEIIEVELCAQECLKTEGCVAFTLSPSGHWAGMGSEITQLSYQPTDKFT